MAKRGAKAKRGGTHSSTARSRFHCACLRNYTHQSVRAHQSNSQPYFSPRVTTPRSLLKAEARGDDTYLGSHSLLGVSQSTKLCDVLLLRSRVGRHGGGLILEPRYESWARMVGVGDETVDEVVKEEEDQDQKEVCDS